MPRPNVNRMRRFIFAALVLGGAPAAARAQRIPARDLLDLPLGTLAEPLALASTLGDGLWNPATIALPGPARARVGFAALTTSAAQGVAGQSLATAFALPAATTVGLALLRASVRDLQRTETDPQTLGEVGYSTTVASVTAARQWRWMTAGLALRFRVGELDGRRRGAPGLDAGVVGRVPWGPDVRVAASSFMWRPNHDAADRPAIVAATDLRLAGIRGSRELRGGYSLLATRGLGRDDYLHLDGRIARFSLAGGVLRSTTYDVVTWGSRLGLGLQHARYVVALSREERSTGLPAVYQITLTSSFQ